MKIRTYDQNNRTFVATKEVRFLGDMIRQGKIMPEASLIGKIMTIKQPQTKHQVRSLMVNFYSCFNPKYSEIVSCLTGLTTGKTASSVINWLPQHTHTLQILQKTVNSRPFLRILDLATDFFLFTDTSKFAVAYCMCKEYDGAYLPTRYISRKLSPIEKNLAIQDQEALAFVWSVTKLFRYLLGRHFLIFTDHCGLTVLPSGNTPWSKRI